MKRMLEQSHWRGASNEWMSGVQHRMQCRATNSLARRIERWSPISCVCPPTRRTRSTELMDEGKPGRFQRPSERVPFSDEGGFVFSKAPFKGTLHEGLKGGFTFGRLQKGLKRFEGGLKGA